MRSVKVVRNYAHSINVEWHRIFFLSENDGTSSLGRMPNAQLIEHIRIERRNVCYDHVAFKQTIHHIAMNEAGVRNLIGPRANQLQPVYDERLEQPVINCVEVNLLLGNRVLFDAEWHHDKAGFASYWIMRSRMRVNQRFAGRHQKFAWELDGHWPRNSI